MTPKELREKETEQLRHDLVNTRKHLFDLRTQAVTEKLEDPSQLRKTRKDIARIMTLLHERGLDQKSLTARASAAADKPAK